MDDSINALKSACVEPINLNEIERLLRIFPLDMHITDNFNRSYMIIAYLLRCIDDDNNQRLFDIIFNALPEDQNYLFNGYTISEIALISRRIDFFEYLVSKIGFNVSLDSQRLAMDDLWYHFDSPEYILKLLKSGFDIQSLNNSNHSMIHSLIENGENELFDIFIENKIQINSKDRHNKLPLHITIKFSDYDKAVKLINNGAIINYTPGEIYMPLLFYAIKEHNIECIELLLNNGASLTDTYEEKDILLYAIEKRIIVKIIDLLVKKGANVNRIYEDNDTILHRASYNNHYDALIYFVSNKIHINTYSRSNFSPLHTFLATHDRNIGHDKVCEITTLFLENGADINDKTSYNQTPLHYAIDTRNIKLCQLLLEKGAIISTDIIDDLPEEEIHIRRQSGLEFTLYDRNIIDCIIETPVPEIIEMMFNQGLELPDDYRHIKSRMIFFRSPENIERCRILLNDIYHNQQKKRLSLEQLCFMSVINKNIEYENIVPKYIINANIEFFQNIISFHPYIMIFQLKLRKNEKRTSISELPDDDSNKHTRLH